jgi:sugar phosphate isomerase/epimerase
MAEKIKRGVSLYSYQQAQFFKQMSWQDQIKEVHDNLKTDGIEIIDESVIPGYPFPSEKFIAEWRNEIARYNMKCVTMDIYLDVMQFRDHVMNHAEAAERLRRDIIIASKLGFQNVRCLCAIPIDVIEACIPTAEEYNVRIGKEIHAPFPIFPKDDWKDTFIVASPKMCEEIMELSERKHTKYVGLVPDFGIFQYRESKPALDYSRRHTDHPKAFDFVIANREKMSYDELIKKAEEIEPGCTKTSGFGFGFDSITHLAKGVTPSALPKEIAQIAKYIVSIHGKFYDMTEIPGHPGQYEDASIDYENPIRYLKQAGYEGYIDSEYEGQRHQQDIGFENLPDEREQVRRHHEMLRRLIGE